MNFQRKKAKRQVAGAMVAGLWGNNNNNSAALDANGQPVAQAQAGGAAPITPPGNSQQQMQHAAPTAPTSAHGHHGHTTGGKKSTAKPRPQIQVPPRGIGPVYEPNHHDVLCGRGGRINAHAGNVLFRELVAAKKSHYLAPSTKKLEKAHIAAEIVSSIRHKQPSGRFLKEDPDGSWFDIGDQKAIKKVGQALREDAPEVRDEIKKKQPRADGEAHSSDDEKHEANAAARSSSPSDHQQAAGVSTSPQANKVISGTGGTGETAEFIAAYELPQQPTSSSSNAHHHHHHPGEYTSAMAPPPQQKPTSVATKINIGMRGMMPKKPAAARYGGSGGHGNRHNHHHHQNNYRQPAVSGAAAQVMSQAQVDDAPMDHAFGRQFHVPETLQVSGANESSVISGMSGPTILSGMSGISALTDPVSTLSASQRNADGNDLMHSLGQSPHQHQPHHYSPHHQQRRGYQQHHHQQQQQNYNNTYDAIRMSQLNQIRQQWAAANAQGRNTSIGTQDTPRSQQLIRTSDTGVSDMGMSGTTAANNGNGNNNNNNNSGMGTLQRSLSWTSLGAAFENMSWADSNSLIGGGMSSQQQQQLPQPEPVDYAGSALSGRSISSFNTMRSLEDNPNNLMLPPGQTQEQQHLAAVEMEAAAAAAAAGSGASVGGRTAGSSRSRGGGYQQRARYFGGGGGGASIKDGASVSMMSINSGNVSLGSVRSIMSDISENIAALDLAEPNMRLLDQYGANL